MLDYIGGHIVSIAKTRSGHDVTLQLQHSENGNPIEQQFHIRGLPPGNPGDKLVVMVLEDEVVGWHNQVTGEQGHLLHALPWLRWRARDAGIALATVSVSCLAGSVSLGLASGLGWLLSATLWRLRSMRSIRGELTEALQLAAGVTLRQ